MKAEELIPLVDSALVVRDAQERLRSAEQRVKDALELHRVETQVARAKGLPARITLNYLGTQWLIEHIPSLDPAHAQVRELERAE